VRAAAFEWLARQVDLRGDVLPRDLLAAGFNFGETRVPLLSPQGIFKPAVLQEVPLSITTTPNGPYNDALGAERLSRHCDRGTNPAHPDNRGLRLAMQRELPLVFFLGLLPGRYMATWPVYIVGDNPADLAFSVAVDDPQHLRLPRSDPADAMLL